MPANYGKLKTNLRLSINRSKLMQKKKTELAIRSRKEIADYIATGKLERARIRVEFIIREDYLVEAMEIVEMYCDLLLARFGMIEQMKTLDDGLAESVSSLIWAAPRLHTDITELKVIAEQLTLKYGKLYAQAVLEGGLRSVNQKLQYKLNIEAPPKHLVEHYMIEIAKSNNVHYEPNLELLQPPEVGKEPLINFVETPMPFPQPIQPMQQPNPAIGFYPPMAPQFPPAFPDDMTSLPPYENALNFPSPPSNASSYENKPPKDYFSSPPSNASSYGNKSPKNDLPTPPNNGSNSEKKLLTEDEEMELLNKRFESLKRQQ